MEYYIKNKLNNVAIFVEDYPSKGQRKKLGVSRDYVLFGLFEGYCQAKKLNLGPVLPDRITIFRQAICKLSSNEGEIRNKIINTLKHEIAHHLGSGETGARKAARKRT